MTNTQMYKYAYKLIQNATSIINECGGCSQRSEVTLNRLFNWAATIQSISYTLSDNIQEGSFVHFIKDVEVDSSMIFETFIKCTRDG